MWKWASWTHQKRICQQLNGVTPVLCLPGIVQCSKHSHSYLSANNCPGFRLTKAIELEMGNNLAFVLSVRISHRLIFRPSQFAILYVFGFVFRPLFCPCLSYLSFALHLRIYRIVAHWQTNLQKVMADYKSFFYILFQGKEGSSLNMEHNNTSPQPNQRQPGEAPNLSVILTIRLLMQGKEVGSIIGKVSAI